MQLEEKLQALSERIRVLRLTKNLRQKEVAERIGMSQSNLSNIEAGRCQITLRNLFILQNVLGCRMCDFFEEIDKAENKRQERPEIKIEDLRSLLSLINKMDIV